MSEGDIKQRMAAWLNSHDTGISSESIFHYMTLSISTGAPPRDPADLGRCVRLLRLFPEWAERMPEMATVSKEWKPFAKRWDELVALFHEEGGEAIFRQWGDWSAPRTYDLMKSVERGQHRKANHDPR